jgi:hypothetical protein
VRRTVLLMVALALAMSCVVAETANITARVGWAQRETPNPPVHSGLLEGGVSCVSTTCVAVGSFNGPSGTRTPLADRRDPTGWSIQATPAFPNLTASYLSSVSCTSADACIAVGYSATRTRQTPLAEVWNGAAWTVQPTASPAGSTAAQLSGVSCTSSSACTAIGFYSVHHRSVPLAEMWDGTSWSVESIPDPLHSSTVLYGLSCTSSTSCIAVGSSTDEFSGHTTGFAEGWDGTTWSIQTVPGPIGIVVLEGIACTSTSSCTAVGHLNQGGNTMTVAERWNGSAWTIQPTVNPPGAFGTYLYSVSCPAADSCIAAGYNEPGTGAQTVVSLMESWDGNQWSVQPTRDPSTAISTFLVSIACTSTTDCLAVGQFGSSGGSGEAPWLATAQSWNGQGWSRETPPDGRGSMGAGLTAVSCSTSSCVGVGDFSNQVGDEVPLVERLSGSTWLIQPTPVLTGSPIGQLASVSCASALACTAVGAHSGDAPVDTLAEGWDGTRWSLEATPTPIGSYGAFLTGVACMSATTCIAVGHYSTAASYGLPLAESWDGSTWTILSVPSPSGAADAALFGISCTAADFCTAVGEYSDPTSGRKTLAETWDGIGWTVQAGASVGTSPELTAVSCTARDACTAAGDAGNGAGYPLTLAERWNGTAWTLQPTPTPRGSVLAKFLSVSCTASDKCDAVGVRSPNSLYPSTLVESWDGTSWSIPAAPSPGGASGAQLNGVSCVSGCVGVGRANGVTFAVSRP